MIGDYDRNIFTADSDIQRSMAQKINEKAESLDGEFAKMYGQIDSLGTHWVGEDYDMFSTGCEGYKTALSDLSASMKMYAGHFEKIATGTDELATTLIGIVQNMTTRYGDGGPGMVGTQGSGTQGSGTGATHGGGGKRRDDTSSSSTHTSESGATHGGGGRSFDTSESGATHGGGGRSFDTSESGATHGGGGRSFDTSESGATHGGAGRSFDTSESGATQNGIVEEQGYWGKLGQRYVDDWNDLKSDVTEAWEGTDGLFSGVWSVGETVLDGAAFVVSGTADTVQGATDIVQSGWNWMFDIGNGRSVQNGSYWENVGKDFGENIDFSTCDNFAEGFGVAVCALPATALDTVQLVGNAAVDVVNGAVEVVDWAAEGVTDVVGAIGNWIFD